VDFFEMLLTFHSYASDIANRLLGYIGDGCGKDGAEGWL
jgi:chemotaxis response regulator CheB